MGWHQSVDGSSADLQRWAAGMTATVGVVRPGKSESSPRKRFALSFIVFF